MMIAQIVAAVQQAAPAVEAVYLFGTWGTKWARKESDLDLALLLPPAEAKQWSWQRSIKLQLALSKLVACDVDLINLRQVDTVFQHQIITANRRLVCGSRVAADSFEMLVLSYYQNLNIQRAAMVEDGYRTGCFYHG